ncbi:hypothetical protein B0H19DRAFT_1255561 [Mycena capillaripes]|nr:hypothetical protein B0H19DRAFT_1255561 [Mycena capillaripes]
MAYAFAATRPVNPPGVEPVITEEQLWKGLEYKARNPVRFVPMMSASKTISEEGNKLVREMTIGNTTVKEETESHPATIIYMELSTGVRMTNVISYGPNNELLLTYGFANGIPGVAAEKPKPSAKELNVAVGEALERGLNIFREMVKEGKL